VYSRPNSVGAGLLTYWSAQALMVLNDLKQILASVDFESSGYQGVLPNIHRADLND
jgi:hypothetical protein